MQKSLPTEPTMDIAENLGNQNLLEEQPVTDAGFPPVLLDVDDFQENIMPAPKPEKSTTQKLKEAAENLLGSDADAQDVNDANTDDTLLEPVPATKPQGARRKPTTQGADALLPDTEKNLPSSLGDTDHKRVYRQRKGQIHTEDGSFLSESQLVDEEKNTAAVELIKSYTQSRVLRGSVFGVRRAATRDNGTYNYYVIAQYGPYQVYIPAERFADENFDALLERYQKNTPNITKNRVIANYLQARLGAEIDFVVTTLPENGLMDSTIVGGSRTDAMRIMRFHYWYRGTKQDGSDLLSVGDKAKMRIISVVRNGIRVEFHGAETLIPLRELSWSMFQDATEHFTVGDEIVVRILSITRGEGNDYPVSFEASVKQSQPDPREAALEKYQDHGIYTGTVSYIRMPNAEFPNSKPRIFVELEKGVQANCPFPDHGNYYTGKRVHVEISSKVIDRKALYGFIRTY